MTSKQFFLTLLFCLPISIFIILVSEPGKNPINYVIYDKGSGNNMFAREIIKEDENCITFIYRTGRDGKFCGLYEVHPQN